MVDVSIVIVNWNTKKLLLDCIGSILNVTLEHGVEVIVVDNGSHDGSSETVMARFPEVKVICNDSNLGFAKANNIGIRASTGRYICLVNSDIKVLEGCIESLCRYMDSRQEVGLVAPQILNGDLSIQVSCSELPSLRNSFVQAMFLDKLLPSISVCRPRFMNAFSHQSVLSVPVLSGCFQMARRKALNEVGLLDERFFIYKEDVDWCKRFCDAGWRVIFYPEAKAIHYGGASSSAAPAKFLIEMEKANRQYWKKHHTWLAQKIAAGISVTRFGLRLIGWTVTYLVKCGNSVNAKEMIRRYAACIHWLIGRGADAL